MRRPVRLIAEEIQRYAVAHPEARDTLEGIVWWIRIQREEEMQNDVADAVSWLVKRGVLHRISLPDGTSVFGSEGRALGSERRDE